MALPQSPSVVVIENDVSIYTPNVQSSVVGIVGFADKGPINTPKLVTSQENLIKKFGKPSTAIPGQALEGALEILEATNQLYFIRAASGSSEAAVVSSTMGFCAGFQLSGATPLDTQFVYSITDNSGVSQVTDRLVTLASSTGNTVLSSIVLNIFSEDNVTSQELIARVEDDGDIFIGSRYAGASSYLTVSAVDTNLKIFQALHASGGPVDESLVGSAGFLGVSGASATCWGGTARVGGPDGLHVKLSSLYDGAGYNLSSLRDGSVQGVSIEIDNVSKRDRLTVNSDGSQVESFTVELSQSSPASVEYLLATAASNNNQSDYVTASVESDAAAYTGIPNQYGDTITGSKQFTFSGAALTLTTTPRFVKSVEGTYNLADGDSGYSTTETGNSNDRASLIGTAAAKTGIYALDDDSLNISISLVPGISHQDVQNALITLAESSKNFVAVVSPPYGYDEAQDAVDWMNGKLTRSSAINNSYAAVYWPWVQVFNFYAAADEWFDPAIFAARQMVYTDNVSEPWFAPAGYRRGRLSKPSDVEVALNQGDKDVLYTNNINPITKEPQAGITVFGQKTAQREPTALDRVNVRRLMVYIRKVLLRLGKPFQFEPNDQFTWELVEDALQPFIDDLLARRAIVEGNAKCDSETNTSLRVDRNEMWTYVTIKPTKAAETVVFQVNLTNQSATING